MNGHDHSWTFKSRGMVGILLLSPVAVAILFSYPLIKEGSPLELLMDSLGWASFLAYVTFRMWATLYIGGRKDKKLQTEGPYSMTRNPLYFGSFCFALSVTCFFKSVSLFFMVGMSSVLYLHFVVKDEEKYLENKFGEEFKKYCQRTPRFLPLPFRYYRSNASLEVNLKALKSEVKRLLCAALLPVSAEIIMHLRQASWWAHWFGLP